MKILTVKLSGLWPCALLTSLLAACVPPAPAPVAMTPVVAPTSQIHQYVGRVLDSDTAAPIHGAEVSLDFQGIPYVVYTDSEGVYKFFLHFNGSSLDVRVIVGADGYDRYDRNITLHATHPGVED